MGSHLKNGLFQSDKYPTCPAGKVPLSQKDKMAWDLLWEYAQRRRTIDPEFSADLETALRSEGYVPPAGVRLVDAREVQVTGPKMTGGEGDHECG
jgi:hypothetical protein